MIKRRDSVYQAGRLKGPWFKWKRDPFNVDAVMMYAQRGHGKRSSYYSISPSASGQKAGGRATGAVGKAYFGFTDAELEVLDKFVRDNTVERFGPVRAVRAEPVSASCWKWPLRESTALRAINPGVAMRFPRISRLRMDKLPRDADRLSTLTAMME